MRRSHSISDGHLILERKEALFTTDASDEEFKGVLRDYSRTQPTSRERAGGETSAWPVLDFANETKRSDVPKLDDAKTCLSYAHSILRSDLIR